jgi:hypothetical protein
MMRFKTYYNHYLALHTRLITRLLHCAGNIATIAFIIGVFMQDLSWWWLLLTPFVVYPFAWTGHFFFERNEPAAFKDPLLAKLSDWRMMWDMLRGKL